MSDARTAHVSQEPDLPPAGARLANRSGVRVALICGLLLVAFGITSWAAIRTKCATYDEPMHSVGAYVLSQDGDYRINYEDPPLWQRWAALAISRGDLKPNFEDPLFNTTLRLQVARWRWVVYTLYVTPGVDADAFIMKLRSMLILLGVALGAVIAW